MSYYKPHTAYLATQVKTATREQLLVMLFDGAIKFCHQAKGAIEAKDIEGISTYCIKVQNIMTELMSTLNRDMIDETLYRNLMSLYAFVHKRMIAANLERNLKAVDESLDILGRLRGMWSETIARVLAENGGKLPDPPPAGISTVSAAPKPAQAPVPAPVATPTAVPVRAAASAAQPAAQTKPAETTEFKRLRINLSR